MLAKPAKLKWVCRTEGAWTTLHVFSYLEYLVGKNAPLSVWYGKEICFDIAKALTRG